MVFFISAGIYLVGNTLYVIFGQGTVQPWNSYEKKETKTENTEKALDDTLSSKQ